MKEDNTKILNHYKKSPLVQKWDVIIGAILVLLLIAMLLIIFLPNDGSEVEVYKNGLLIASYPLNENRAFSVGEMQIEIFNGSVSVVESNCPDKLCVHSKPINKEGSTIICVPNKVVIKITGNSEVEGITQ